MKKLLKVIGYIVLGFLGLLIVGVGVLAITGFPKPARIEVRNISKASIGQVPDIVGLMSSVYTRYELIRTNGSQVVFLKNGQPMELDINQKTISPSGKFMPRTGMFGQTQYHDGVYYFLQENPSTEDRLLLGMEESTGKVDTLFAGANGTYDFKLSDDGKEILLIDQEDATGEYFLYRIDIITEREPQLLIEPDELISFQSFGPDRSYMIIQEILVSGQVRYLKLDLEDLSLSSYESTSDSSNCFLSNTARIICNNHSFTNNFGTSYFIRTGDRGLAKIHCLN